MLDTTRIRDKKKLKHDKKYDTKNNMNTTRKHKYVKIIWIKDNKCQNLYITLNTI